MVDGVAAAADGVATAEGICYAPQSRQAGELGKIYFGHEWGKGGLVVRRRNVGLEVRH